MHPSPILDGVESNIEEIQEYIRPEDRIYAIATNRDELDWKGFLYNLINREGLNPWDVDLSILTHTYLNELKTVSDVDFDISGKLLTIAVFLLKTKAEYLVEHDIRGIEEKIESVQYSEDSLDFDLEGLEDLDGQLELMSKKKETYKLKVRNPIARKRKVNIFDLIKTLEKTFIQSNTRRKNFLMKNSSIDYKGPEYSKKSKDLKQIIEELFGIISEEFSQKKAHVKFHSLFGVDEPKMGILDKFIPLLHLHNQTRVEVKQDSHFGDIRIHKIN
jgi:segregation and condensation protein A